jgi:hypothetical protein
MEESAQVMVGANGIVRYAGRSVATGLMQGQFVLVRVGPTGGLEISQLPRKS